MRELTAALVMIALALLACGGGEPQEANGNGQPESVDGQLEVDRSIVVLDSIGVELGDSNYVFGQPQVVSWTPEGNIAVLDMQLAEVRVFDGQGSYLYRFGREGSGPGEFLMPTALAVSPDGRFVVSDAMGRKLLFFDGDGTHLRSMEGFFPTPPLMIEALDSAIVGAHYDMQQTEEGMLSGMSLCRWEDDIAPVVNYHSDLEPFNPETFASEMGQNMVIFTTSPDGRVYRSSVNPEQYVLVGYEPDGTEFLRVEEQITPVPKTTEEINEEREMVRNRMIQSGAPPSMAEGYEPQPNRPSVAGMHVDDEGRLWIRLGTTDAPTFRVLDADGQELFVAAVEYSGENSNWTFSGLQDGRMLAVDVNPEMFPKVYILELEGE